MLPNFLELNLHPTLDTCNDAFATLHERVMLVLDEEPFANGGNRQLNAIPRREVCYRNIGFFEAIQAVIQKLFKSNGALIASWG
ncbi:hypothetical protein D3C85_1271440 [compost metagenome]